MEIIRDFLNFYREKCEKSVNELIETFAAVITQRTKKLSHAVPVAHTDEGPVKERIPALVGWRSELRNVDNGDEERHEATTTQEIAEALEQLRALKTGVTSLSEAFNTRSPLYLSQQQFASMTGMAQVAYNAYRATLLTRDGRMNDETQPAAIFYSDRLREQLAKLPAVAREFSTNTRDNPVYQKFQTFMVTPLNPPPPSAPSGRGPGPELVR